MKKKVIFVIIIVVLILLWILGIYKLSSMNLNNSNAKSSEIIGAFIEDTLEVTNKYGITNSHPGNSEIAKATRLLNTPLRKVMHASVYFVLAFMLVFVINYLFNHKRIVISAIITVVLIIIAASFDEYHQTFVDGRSGEIKDVLIDTIGGTGGILFYGSYYYVYKKGYKKSLEEINEVGEINEQNKKKKEN